MDFPPGEVAVRVVSTNPHLEYPCTVVILLFEVSVLKFQLKGQRIHRASRTSTHRPCLYQIKSYYNKLSTYTQTNRPIHSPAHCQD